MWKSILSLVISQLLCATIATAQQLGEGAAVMAENVVWTTTELNYRLIFMLAIFLTAALFFLTFYFGFSRRGGFLWLSLYCIAHALKAIFKPEQNFFTTDWLTPLQQIDNLYLIVLSGGICLIGFLLWEIHVPRRWQCLGIFAAFAGISYCIMTEFTFLICLVLIGFSIIGDGFKRQVEGRFWLLLGMLGLTICIFLGQNNWIGFGYFVGIIVFISFMTISVAQQVAQQIRMRQAALLRSATLENQLLKKSIQPHFIFNSLASLQELIEQEPTKASDFVEQLASEFRLVNKMAERPWTTLAEELTLCRAHLRIMEYRKNAQFTLTTIGIDGSERIPPGVFHTLLENGITHGYGVRWMGYFQLKKEKTRKETIYTFFNDSESTTQPETRSNGTGMKYIEARLQEAYPNNWKLVSQAVKNGWQVQIKLKCDP